MVRNVVEVLDPGGKECGGVKECEAVIDDCVC